MYYDAFFIVSPEKKTQLFNDPAKKRVNFHSLNFYLLWDSIEILFVC